MRRARSARSGGAAPRRSAAVVSVRVAGAAVLLAGASFAAAQSAGAAARGAGETGAVAKAAGVAAVKADFDKDGYADQVFTAPKGTVGGVSHAGYVAVVYGSAHGADPGRRQVISLASEGVPGDPQADAGWGYSAVARDVDGDGRTDLAVTAADGSGVTVLWGSPGAGLTGGHKLADELRTTGHNLVGGDFNGDGHADLAAGSTDGEEIQENIRVMYGPFHRDGQAASSETIDSTRTFEPTDLIAGDLTGDGVDDLVSTHAFEEMSESSQFWKGSRSGFAKTSTSVDHAATGTVGDVDKDGYGDLVIRTVPGGVVENLPYDHGTVKVVYGTAKGPGTRTTTLTQNSAGVPGANEDGDQFGYRLVSGDANGDGYADIAVGVPYEDLTGASTKDTGAAVLLKGGAKGLTGAGAQAFHQDTGEVPGVAEKGDRFGTGLAFQDTDADGRDDLGIGTPGEDGTKLTDTGAGWVLRGAVGGLTTSGVVSFGPGGLGAPEAGAALGSDLAR